MSTTTETPRVWVGCLACYSAGTLRGEWVDAIAAAEFVPCEGRGHEEWWVFDHEGFGGVLVGECSPMAAQEIAEQIESVDEWQRGAWFAYVKYQGIEYAGGFEDAYCGEFDSAEGYAQSLAADCGYMDREFHWPFTCIDWERAARELDYDGYYFIDSGEGTVYVFSPA